MATSTPPDDAEQQPPARRPFWKLREDDQRLVFATFLGGLAANVGLGLILALGLLVVHGIRKFGVNVFGWTITLLVAPEQGLGVLTL